MRGSLLGFVLTGRYYANLRPALRLYATKQIQLAVPTVEDMEDVGGLIATITFFSEKGNDTDGFAKGRKLFLHGDLGAGG